MHFNYAVYGGVLRSEIEFPDLSILQAAASPDWTVQEAPHPLPLEAESQIGQHTIGGFEVRLFRRSSALRLDFDIYGSYLIRQRGSEIIWYPDSREHMEMVRAVVLGPVLALALHEAGVPCFHGSSVEVAGVAIAFLGPKHYGKSTLALALVKKGGILISDDAIAVELDPAPVVRPGVHSVRLNEDSAERLDADRMDGRLLDGRKKTLVGLPAHLLGIARVPLAAVYCLQPIVPGTAPSRVQRAPMNQMQATLMLAQHTKVAAPLIGTHEAGSQLRWSAKLVQHVPVYALALDRDFDSLPEIAATVLGWHQGLERKSNSM